MRLTGRLFALVATCCRLGAGHVAANHFGGEPWELSRPIDISSSNSSQERGPIPTPIPTPTPTGRRTAEARMNEANVLGIRGGGVMEHPYLALTLPYPTLPYLYLTLPYLTRCPT